MILVGQYDSPYTRRVAISLHVLGIDFARNTISVFSNAEEMRRINPLGRIPSLVLDSGEVLIDSVAILDYLDELVGPERALLPARGEARRRALQLIALATGTLDKAGAIVYERSLRPAEKVHQPWIERCRVQVDSGLAALEDAVGAAAGYYLGGDRVMQPDITLGCVLDYFSFRFREAFAVGAYPKLERLLVMFGGLAAFRATRPAEDEIMPGALVNAGL